jgi:hypothetical protein
MSGMGVFPAGISQGLFTLVYGIDAFESTVGLPSGWLPASYLTSLGAFALGGQAAYQVPIQRAITVVGIAALHNTPGASATTITYFVPNSGSPGVFVELDADEVYADSVANPFTLAAGGALACAASIPVDGAFDTPLQIQVSLLCRYA